MGNDAVDALRRSLKVIKSVEQTDVRPHTIRVVQGDLERIVNEAEAALLDGRRQVYQRGPFIVRSGTAQIPVAGGHKVEGVRIVEMGKHGLMEAMTSAARWEKFDGRCKDWVETDAPMKIVETYRDREGRWRLPVLAGIISAPTLRPDGSIVTTPGYDRATGLLFNPRGRTFPAVPLTPSKQDAVDALVTLGDLIKTFDFVGLADRSVALSGILTAVARPALPTTPMHAYTAPVRGSGKSMLVDLCSLIVSGREAGVIAQGKSEEEFEKRLGSMLLAGDTVVAIDNVQQPLGGEFLCQVLSQTVVRTRILSRSMTPELPSNAFITANGNNLQLVGDVTRRALLCRLDPKVERPELRSFDQDPVQMVRADQGRYVCAALTVLRAFHVAGRPGCIPALASYAEWSGLVRGALLWLGETDPVKTMEFARENDPERAEIIAVIAQWADVLKTDAVTAKAVVEKATASQIDSFGRTTFEHPDFREALLVVAGAGGSVNSRKLGNWIRSHKDQVVNGQQIVSDGTTDGSVRWKLQRR